MLLSPVTKEPSLLKQLSWASKMSINILGQDTRLLGFSFAKQGHFLQKPVTIYRLHDFINENILAPKRRKDVISQYRTVFDTDWALWKTLFSFCWSPASFENYWLAPSDPNASALKGPLWCGLYLVFPISYLPHTFLTCPSLSLVVWASLCSPWPHTPTSPRILLQIGRLLPQLSSSRWWMSWMSCRPS